MNPTRFESVKIERMIDDNPDFSWIGEYTSAPGPDDRTIDREERGDCGRGEYRYFVATNSAEDTGNPNSVEQDYERMEDYNRGGWCFVGIRAVAVVYVNNVKQELSSGGLWGIESDSDNSYFAEVGREQLEELRGILQTLGFADSTISKHFRNATTVEA